MRTFKAAQVAFFMPLTSLLLRFHRINVGNYSIQSLSLFLFISFISLYSLMLFKIIQFKISKRKKAKANELHSTHNLTYILKVFHFCVYQQNILLSHNKPQRTGLIFNQFLCSSFFQFAGLLKINCLVFINSC